MTPPTVRGCFRDLCFPFFHFQNVREYFLISAIMDGMLTMSPASDLGGDRCQSGLRQRSRREEEERRKKKRSREQRGNTAAVAAAARARARVRVRVRFSSLPLSCAFSVSLRTCACVLLSLVVVEVWEGGRVGHTGEGGRVSAIFFDDFQEACIVE